jgi:hypothetical protein
MSWEECERARHGADPAEEAACQMSELAVITPSFAPDVELFTDLHRSVLEHTPDRTVHYVIVPPADRAIFAQYAGPRCQVWTYSDFLPRRYLGVPWTGQWVNARRPWPPVRGWILQQAIKIAAASMVDAGAVLIADSDVVLVRATTMERFRVDGRLCLYRAADAVHAGMARLLRWHDAARRLLGLPAAHASLLPDYVSPLNVWEPAVVRAMQQQVSEVTGKDWLDAFTHELHVSEFILYGVFIDQVASPERLPPLSDTTLCHDYWDRTPLDHDQALTFADAISTDAVAMMISAKSNTPPEVRRAAARRIRSVDTDRHVADS